jgi:predicted lipid-binding transport protein (Tim44 family)
MLKNSVKIIVDFDSEQINILKNADGEVVEGDENFVQNITDVWTFERSLNAKSKNWLLVSTKKSA